MTLQEPVTTRERTTNPHGWRTAPQASPPAAARTNASICKAGDTYWAIAGGNYPPNDMSSPDCVTWTDVSTGAVMRPGNRGMALDGQLYTSGGLGNPPSPRQPPQAVPEVWGRNPAVPGSWGRAPGGVQWQGRREHMMTGFDGKLWVIGGANASYQWFADAWWATPDFAGGWHQDTTWTGPARGNSGVAVYNNELWIICGQTNDPYVGMLGDAVAKAPGPAWQTRSLPGDIGPRTHVQAQVAAGKLYVFAGTGTTGNRLDMFCFDGATWTSLPDSCPWSVDLTGYYSTVKDDEIYVMGGFDRSSARNQTIYIYNPN